jgi:hypothetical protein
VGPGASVTVTGPAGRESYDTADRGRSRVPSVERVAMSITTGQSLARNGHVGVG